MNILMKRHALLGLATLTLAMASGAAMAQSISIGDVRVRLPNGESITIGDDYDHWYRDPRVVAYDHYYYDPDYRGYVVYDNDHPPEWVRKHFKHREHRWCPPGLAKQGRC